MEAILNTSWTLDELRTAFAVSEFQLKHIEAIWSAGEPTHYLAEFRCGDKPVTFQFTFNTKFSLAESFQVLREDVADFPVVAKPKRAFAAGSSTATGDY